MSKPSESKHDRSRADAMTDVEIHAAALSDPDAQPLTPECLADWTRTPQIKTMRRALRLSQEDFAARFQIPSAHCATGSKATKTPDAAARAYLKVIGRNPEMVRVALPAGR